ncbi:MAG: sugar kinase [Chloroflexi bacterium]|nr:sugar kinase [Chloroflexota bacterium]
MSILVVGSVALDSVQTPFGKVDNVLGGSATYFSVAASLYAPVRVVGVVGTDFSPAHVDFLRSRNVDLAGLQTVEGQTFRWSGRYGHDLNTAETLETRLNVFATFRPQLPQSYRQTPLVFLANIDPDLQLDVLRQIKHPRLVALDTMNFWIKGKKDALTEVLRKVDIVLVNEAEARQYAGTSNLLQATHEILALGPRAVIVKKGEYGAALYSKGDSAALSFFFAPAYPLAEIKDPTGAGDTFAGGFLGYLAKTGAVDARAIRRAIIHGSVVASFTVEDFSMDRLRNLTWPEVAGRYEEFKRFTYFEKVED